MRCYTGSLVTMRAKRSGYLLGFVYSTALVCGLYGFMATLPALIVVSLCALLIASLLYFLLASRSATIVLLFNVSIFVLLVGRAAMRYMSNIPMESDTASHTFALLLVLISTIVINSTFLLLQSRFAKIPTKQKSSSIAKDYRFRFIVGVLFILTTLFALIKNTFLFYFAATNGYNALYLGPGIGLPPVIIAIADISPIALGLYLATMPSKVQSHIALASYTLLQIPMLMAGKRMLFIAAVMAWVSYIFLRSKTEKGDISWIGFKEKLSMIIIVPVLIVMIPVIGALRGNNATKDPLYELLDSQGVTLDVIAFGITFADDMPKSIYGPYVTAPLVDYLLTNYVARLTLGTQEIPAQSEDSGTLGKNYADAISYRSLSRENYLGGQGLGSSYIIESFVDFGILGVAAMSAIIGLLLLWITYRFDHGFWTTWVICVLLLYVYQIPRGKVMDIILPLIQFHALLIIFAIFFATRLYNGIVIERSGRNDK